MNNNEVPDIIVCPYCGHKHDVYEYTETGDMSGEFEMPCDRCKREFKVDYFSIFYCSTDKKE